jgi:cupin fold WbuC family metalloprotein
MRDYRQVNDEVFYATDQPATAGWGDVAFLKEAAAKSPRQRARLCAHRDTGDLLHDMIIVMKQNSYVRPHRHASRAESLLVLEGEAEAVFFDGFGQLAKLLPMVPFSGRGVFFYRIDSGVYHTLLVRSPWLVFAEATTGPFSYETTEPAPWSPAESSGAAVAEYLAKLDEGVRGFMAPEGPCDGS